MTFCSLNCDGQARIASPLIGYSEILHRRFSDEHLWFEQIELNLNSLVKLEVEETKRKFIIPLKCIQGKDTLVIFCNSQSLRKMKGQRDVKFNEGHLFKKASIYEMPISTLSKRTNVSFDSVFHYMKGNILVNSSRFDLDAYLSKNVSDYCCRGNGYENQLKLLYIFFINGIILNQKEGALYFQSF